jgi:hypothetical protein
VHAFFGNGRSYDRVEKDDDKNVTKIAPYPAVCEKTDQDLGPEQKNRYDSEYQTSQTKPPLPGFPVMSIIIQLKRLIYDLPIKV